MTNLELMRLLGDHEPDLCMALETPGGYLLPVAVVTLPIRGTRLCVIRSVMATQDAQPLTTRMSDGP